MLKKVRSQWPVLGLIGYKCFARQMGKVEAFNRRINVFLPETALERPQTLDALNQNLESWINEYYHKSDIGSWAAYHRRRRLPWIKGRYRSWISK